MFVTKLRGFMTQFNGFNVNCDHRKQTDWIINQLKGFVRHVRPCFAWETTEQRSRYMRVACSDQLITIKYTGFNVSRDHGLIKSKGPYLSDYNSLDLI